MKNVSLPVRAYLDFGSYKIPLQEVSYWSRGASFVRNEFSIVNERWREFKKDNDTLKEDFDGKPVQCDKQSNIVRHNNYLDALNVFYITCGHPIGDVDVSVKNLFSLMEKNNVCAPVSADNKNIRLVTHN
jgi:hypothetical protein